MDQNFVRGRLKQLVDERGLKVGALSLEAKLGDQRLRHYLAGRIQSITPYELRNILNVARVDEKQFFDAQCSLAPAEHSIEKFYQIPVFGEIPAGNPTWIEGNQVPTEYVPGDHRDMRRNAFGLRVSGRSMEPRYLPNDLIVLRPLSIPLPVKNPQKLTPRATFDALHGRNVAVLLNGEATLKMLEVEPLKGGDYNLHLRPLNPAYQSVTIQPADEAHFQGEVYKIVREE